MDAHEKSVVITGASTGIGKACALALAAQGWHVFAGVLEPRPPKGWLLRHFYAAAGQILDESLYFWDFALSDFDADLMRAGLGLLKLQRCFHQLFAVYVCEPVNRRSCRPTTPVSEKSAVLESR